MNIAIVTINQENAAIASWLAEQDCSAEPGRGGCSGGAGFQRLYPGALAD